MKRSLWLSFFNIILKNIQNSLHWMAVMLLENIHGRLNLQNLLNWLLEWLESMLWLRRELKMIGSCNCSITANCPITLTDYLGYLQSRSCLGFGFLSLNLQSPTKVLARLPTFSASVWEIYQFIPLPPIQCCSSWWISHCSFPTLSGGGEGLLFKLLERWHRVFSGRSFFSL